MKFYEKLQLLRKERGLSQEALAEMLDVSRQAVSKWESGISYPETDKLVALSDLFSVTLDSLVKDGPLQYKSQYDAQHAPFYPPPMRSARWAYEYKSKRTLFGLPLVHINCGFGLKRAKGIIAIGTISTGLLSLGLLSVGLLSIGFLGLGLITLASVAVGLLFALGAVSIGTIAVGAVAIGIVSFGALSIGMYSTGALAVGSRIAVGAHAYGHIAVGRDVAEGTRVFLDTSGTNSGHFVVGVDAVRAAIAEEFPNLWGGIVRWMTMFIR